jgi:hypothetical protein
MSTQTFACPACGNRKSLADAQPGEKVHCTCGMSYPASPVFEVHDVGQKTGGLRWALIVGISIVIGSGVSAGWLMTRPKPPMPFGGAVAKNPVTPDVGAKTTNDATDATEQPDGNPASDTQPPKSQPDKLPTPEPKPAPTPPPPPLPPPVASLAAVTLWDAFDLDPQAAEARFRGKVVEITARGKLAEDSLGRSYFGAVVVQKGGRKPPRLSPEEQQWETDGYPPSVRCYVNPDQAAEIEKAPADQGIILRGICTGRKDIDGVYRGYIVELNDCIIVAPK